MSYWKVVVLSSVSVQFIFESYLGLRQYSYTNRIPRPTSRSASTNPIVHGKSQAYFLACLQYHLFHRLYHYLWDFSILYGDGIATLWDTVGFALSAWAPASFTSFNSQSLVFAYICFLIPALMNLPGNYYFHFHIEERFGLNRLSIRLWLTDFCKTQLIFMVLVVFLKPAIVISQRWAKAFLSFYGLPVFVLQLLASLLSPNIASLFFTLVPLPTSQLRQSIEELSTTVRFPSFAIKVMNGSKRTAHSNAYISGILRKEIVLFDTLIATLSEDEIVAVVAHEMGHWKLGHALRLHLPLQVRILCVLNFVRMFWLDADLFASFGFPHNAVYPAVVCVVLIRKALSPLDALTKLLLNAQSRKYEFEAGMFVLVRRHFNTSLESVLILQDIRRF